MKIEKCSRTSRNSVEKCETRQRHAKELMERAGS